MKDMERLRYENKCLKWVAGCSFVFIWIWAVLCALAVRVFYGG